MRRPEDLGMESGQSYEGAVYENDFEVRRFKKTEKAKEIPAAGSTKPWVILILWILQVVAFITLAIFIGLLYIFYKNIEEEISQLKSNRIGSCCPEGWIPVGSKCYYFQENLDTWERSREECAKNYSVLLTLKDKDELRRAEILMITADLSGVPVYEAEMRSGEHVFHFSSQDTPPSVIHSYTDDQFMKDSLLPFMKGNYSWIGLRRATQNSTRWVWLDGTPLTFSTLWYETEPNNLGGNENCAEIWKPYQSVNDVRCDEMNPSICKAQSRC